MASDMMNVIRAMGHARIGEEEKMRDPKRIRKFCNRLAAAWEMYPEFRFGQFMVNCLGAMKRDPFFPEDDEMIEHIEQWAAQNTPYARKNKNE